MDLNHFREDNEENVGVGNEDNDVFLRNRGDSGRIVNGFRVPLFRFAFLVAVGRRWSPGNIGREEEVRRTEFRKGKEVRGSEGYDEDTCDVCGRRLGLWNDLRGFLERENSGKGIEA